MNLEKRKIPNSNQLYLALKIDLVSHSDCGGGSGMCVSGGGLNTINKHPG